MSRTCFISYKNEDGRYKNELKRILEEHGIRYYVIEERIDSRDSEYVIRYIREHGIQDSTVTLFLIGENSSELEGVDGNGFDKNYYIQRELQASLYDGDNNRRSGILGIVLPSMENFIFGGSYQCDTCGGSHRTVRVNDKTVIREFSRNYFMRDHAKACCWSDDERYCVLVRWSDFIDTPAQWIEVAYKKRLAPIAEKVIVRPEHIFE